MGNLDVDKAMQTLVEHGFIDKDGRPKQIASKLEDAELARDSEETCNNKQVTSKLVASEDCISRADAEALFRNARGELHKSAIRNEQNGHPIKDLPTRDLMLLNAEQMIHLLPSVTPKQEPRWIPVSEPPKKLGTYLIQTDGEYMCECRWTDVNPYWTDKKTKPHWNIFDIPQYSKVVAWMPKPAPYKAESEDAK